ncbi:MAG TPA: VirB8/TrbF family protein [Thermoanaerobaculia bacterium]|jgi:type IV secretion system protein VirB5|nr:VirB8/TrbF family protein [Thermoanaerobaculia bacterium]
MSENVYAAARAEFQTLLTREAIARRNWQVATFLALGLALVAIVAYIHLATTAKVVPYLVAVDKAGRLLPAGPPDPLRKTDPRLIHTELARALFYLRARTSDPVLQREFLYRAFSYLRGDAAVKVTTAFQRHDPRVSARQETREIGDITVLNLPGTPVYRVGWVEEVRSIASNRSWSETWEGYFTTAIATPDDSDELERNPLGLFITALTWTTLRRNETWEPSSPQSSSVLASPSPLQSGSPPALESPKPLTSDLSQP